MWLWMDTELIDEEYDEDLPIKDRLDWWEVMVNHLIEIAGVICLV
jgi:hypothetical protein